MKALSIIVLLLFLFFSIDTASARCKTRTVAYYPNAVVYATPVVVEAYTVCPCSGTWGSPSCNCPDTTTYTCNSCDTGQYYPVPGHWHGNQYEVYYDMSSVYPTPTMYEMTDTGYALDP